MVGGEGGENRWIPDKEMVKGKAERQKSMRSIQDSMTGPVQLEHRRIDEGFSWEQNKKER